MSQLDARESLGLSNEGFIPITDDIIERIIESKRQNYKNPIVTEVEKLKCFYEAEEYHQAYLDKNPGGYCHVSFDTLKD